MTSDQIVTEVKEAGLSEPLNLEVLEQLDTLADKAASPDALADAAEELGGQAGLYLRGLAWLKQDEEEEALASWLTLSDQLSQANEMPALKRLSVLALDACDSPGAARHLLEACAATQDREAAKERSETLLRCLPKDPRALLVAGRARQDTGAEGYPDLYARAVEKALRKGDEATAEEAFLFLIETDDRPALLQAAKALIRAAREGRGAWAAGMMETGGPAFTRVGIDGEILEVAVEAAKQGADLEPLRAVLTRSLKEAHAGKAYLPKLLEMTGIETDKYDMRTSLMRIEEVFAFPPGRYVAHLSFGIGPVLDTDGESVTIDFSKKGEKKMSLNMANKALNLLPADDIRVQVAKEKEAIEQEVKKDRVAVLVRGLRHLGGEGSSKELKGALTPHVLSEKSWAAWWRKARDSALQDPRVSTVDAYKEQYRLATGDEEESLPDLDSVKKRGKALKLLKKFLKDQPDLAEDAKEAWSPLLERWLREKLDLKTRALVLLQLDKWNPDRAEKWIAEIGKLFRKDLEVGVATTAEDQDLLLDLGLRSKAREDAALQGLTSRYAKVREKAMDALVSEGPEALDATLRKILAQGSAGQILQVARWYAGGGEGGFQEEGFSPWRLISTLMTTLALDEEGKAEKELLDLLDPEGELAARLSKVTLPDELHGSLRMGLRTLRNHFQLSHRARAFLEATGAANVISEEDAEETGEEGVNTGAILGEGLLVSRGTARRLERRAEKLKKELQTTIPAEILKAREHGDLRENAEYKAAKEKQAHTVQALDEIKASLQSVRFLEDLPWEDGRILPGAEVVLESDGGEERHLWLLGDGEDYLGEEVISYRSPLGTNLLGRREGETLTLPFQGEDVPYTIRKVTRRIPTAEETEEQA